MRHRAARRSLDSGRISAPGRLPTFLIIGAAKCGTTSLAAWLAEHPEAFVAPGKELHFFTRQDNWERGTEWYTGHFAGAGDAPAVGEATPTYVNAPRALERIRELLPDARLVLCVRDPVARAYSHWQHWTYRHASESRSFAQAVDDELSGRLPPRTNTFSGYDAERPQYVGDGQFIERIEGVTRLYPRDALHVVFLEDLERDPDSTFAEVCRHLGIDNTVRPPSLGSRENAAHDFRPRWAWRLLVRHRDRLPLPLARWMALNVFRTAPLSEPMDGAVRAGLAEHYRPYNRRLATWLGRDLPGWT